MNKNKLPDIIEVKTLIDNLQYLEKQLPTAIRNWKKQIKTCDNTWAHMSKGVLKRLCKNPSIIHSEIFAPVLSFLNTYIANREGRIAFTGKALDKFLIRGLNAVQKYTIISDHFARNPRYFVPDVPISKGFKAYTSANVEQKKYKEFIFRINERLIGCKDNLNFLFLGLLSTVKNMPRELRDMKNYLDQQCLFMRTARLNM